MAAWDLPMRGIEVMMVAPIIYTVFNILYGIYKGATSQVNSTEYILNSVIESKNFMIFGIKMGFLLLIGSKVDLPENPWVLFLILCTALDLRWNR